MKQTFHYIKDAWQLIHRKKFSDAIVVLDRIIDSSKGDPYPLFLKAIACLYLDKFNEADIILSKIAIIDPSYKPFIQLKAFLALKSAINSESALNSYLDVIEKTPDDELLLKARRALSYCNDFKELQKRARIHDYVFIPKPPKHLMKLEKEKYIQQKKKLMLNSYKRKRGGLLGASKRQSPGRMTKMLFVVALVASVALSAYLFFTKLLSTKPGKPLSLKQYAQVDKVFLGDDEYSLLKKINQKKVPVYYYSSRQLQSEFYEAKKLIKQGDFNQALYILNRINNSNINQIVKEKVDFLISFVMHIEERNYEPADYNKIQKNSYLYRGYAIILRGKVTNLTEKQNSMTLTMLVDYRPGDVFSGIAEVYVGSVVDIKNSDIIELQGIYISPIGVDKRGYISAKMVKKIIQ